MKKQSVIFTEILLAGAILLFAEDVSKVVEQNQLLENELALARLPATYMIMNLQEHTILLKARGMILRKWNISKIKYWGKPIFIKTFNMTGKSALSKPQRPNITPGKEETKNNNKKKEVDVDLGVLELKNMPVHYGLFFEDDIHVSIRPKTKRFWPTLMNIGKSVSWFTYLPLETLWMALKKKSFTEIEIVLPSERDAQGLYWSFLDGQATIIYRPRQE